MRRKIVWVPTTFEAVSVANGALLEFTLATETMLQEQALGRPTIGLLYGRVTLAIPRQNDPEATALGAWGICLKESDAPAGAFGAFSPIEDGGSSIWMTWHGYSLLKTEAANTQGDVFGFDYVSYDILVKNPRKAQEDQELVMIVEVSPSSSASAVWVVAELRCMLILP